MIFLTGAAWGILYDTYRLGWSIYHGRQRQVNPVDLIFWFCSAVLVSVGLIIGNWLEIRFYTMIGLAAGYFVYTVLGRPLILPAIKLLRRLVDYALAPWVGLRGRIGLFRRWNSNKEIWNQKYKNVK